MGFDNAELQDEHLVSDSTSFVGSFRGLLLLTRGIFLLSRMCLPFVSQHQDHLREIIEN